ncbi:MAG: hypothetical protein ABH869_04530, partial [Candidatus Omnitrophota bacterium]
MLYYNKRLIAIIVIELIFFIVFIPFARAGTLKFEDVPVDITTSSNEDLVITPGEGGNTQIGNASGTNSNATSNDDIHVTGVIESDGTIYADGGISAGGNVSPNSDSLYNMGTSSLAWAYIYTDIISTTSSTDLSLSPALGSGVDSAVTRSSATGNEIAYDMAATVNKSTSGNFTALKFNITNTASPGLLKLADFMLGSTSIMQLYEDVNSANYGRLSIGTGAWDGSTSGYFAGSAGGTQIAVNTPAAFSGNLLDMQIAGTSKFKVDAGGNVTAAGTFSGAGILGGTGTAGRVTKWTAETTLADSGISDSSNAVAITIDSSENVTLTGDLAVNGGDLTSIGALAITPLAGTDLSVVLSGAGDLVVNTNDLFIDTSANKIGVGTAAPAAGLDVQAGVTAASASAKGVNLEQTLTAGANNDAMTALYVKPTYTDGAYTGVTHYGMIIESGKVGIGTTVPTAGLAIGTGTNTNATSANDMYVTGNLEVDGSSWLGDAEADTLTVQGALTVTDLEFTGHVIPAADDEYDLGSSTEEWRNLFVDGVANIDTLSVTGATSLDGGLTMDTDKFTVADATGNTAIAGTLTATGATALNGGLTMDTDKFTVADTTGNTAIAGTLGVTGNTTLTADLAVNGGNINFGAATTIGDNLQTIAMDSSDWDISALGVMTGISGITTNGVYTQSGSSQNTFTGNIDASSGIDISGAALTIANQAITQTTGGQVTLAGNVDATSGIDISGAALTIANQAITQTTGGQVTFAGNVDAASGIDITGANLTV